MTLRRFLLALGACLAVSGPADAQRLPTTVIPEHYDLMFAIDLAHERFEGTTAIDVRLAQPSSRVVLHALDMDFGDVTITSGGRNQKASVTLDKTTQTAALTVGQPIPAGAARIQLAYRAKLNDQLRGLYLSKGRNRSYAVTQLEATDARRAFPCFDEPAFKATFTVTVIADRGDIAISNGKMTADVPGPSPTQHTMTFAPTAKMSSYLVAIAVGDFQCLEGSADAVPIRICATPDKKELGHLALEATEDNLRYLNRYHTIKYPFAKLDVVAVPDFAAGAMENTAAIFYREADLLADSATASLATRKTIVAILAHEMAHQWFGDLVTMQWWDDVWLNEGFATWMAQRPSIEAKPEWHIDVDQALENQSALSADSLKSTRAIHAGADTPEEIESAFDAIAYQKGAAVLRMVESYLGEDVFRKGVNAYIEQHKYSNASAEDFFGALSKASGKPVDRVMGSFVLQPGVPQVGVTAACAGGRTTVTLTQERFQLDRDASSSARDRWQVPLCLKTPGVAKPACVVLSEPSQTVPIVGACSPWVFANAGGKGYYRTSYSPELIKALARDAESGLSAPERLSLLSDEWALVRAGRHSVADYLSLASGFGGESSAPVLANVTGRLAVIDSYITNDRTRAGFRAFVRGLLRPAYDRMGGARDASDSEDRRSLRNAIVGALGNIAEDPDVIASARAAVDASLGGGPALDPIAAGTLVNVAATHGDRALFDRLLDASGRANAPEEHYRYLYALTSFTDPALIDRALEYARSTDLRSQDAAIYLGSFFSNDAARDRAWTFVRQHWPELEPKITISLGDVSLVGSLSAFCSAEKRDEVRAFFGPRKLPSSGRPLAQTIERIDNCIRLRETQGAQLAAWLAR